MLQNIYNTFSKSFSVFFFIFIIIYWYMYVCVWITVLDKPKWNLVYQLLDICSFIWIRGNTRCNLCVFINIKSTLKCICMNNDMGKINPSLYYFWSEHIIYLLLKLNSVILVYVCFGRIYLLWKKHQNMLIEKIRAWIFFWIL